MATRKLYIDRHLNQESHTFNDGSADNRKIYSATGNYSKGYFKNISNFENQVTDKRSKMDQGKSKYCLCSKIYKISHKTKI